MVHQRPSPASTVPAAGFPQPRRRQIIQTILTSLTFSVFFTYTYVQLVKLEPKIVDKERIITIEKNVTCPDPPPPLPPPQPVQQTVIQDADILQLQQKFDTWYAHLKKTGGDEGVQTARVGCRELEAKAQTCSFEGMICMDTSYVEEVKRARVFFVDDTKQDMTKVPTDDWCYLRHQSADPKYYSSRHWPLLEDTVVPQQSCMDAWYRTSQSLFEGEQKPTIKWVPRQLTMIDHDFLENDHNGHLASDTLWMLDVALFQESLSLSKKRPGHVTHRSTGDEDGLIWSNNFTLYLPQSREQFHRGMDRDVNRLLYALILRKNLKNLYPDLMEEDLKTPPDPENTVRYSEKFLKAFPELDTDDGILFHSDLVVDNSTDLVCAPKLASGFKTGFSIDERTCRELRTKSYELFGIERPQLQRVGQILFPQPKKSLLILDRHQNRRIGNPDEVYEGLAEKLKPYGVPVTVVKTDKLRSAEEFVRLYSSAGIILSPHGSQNMGQMWMQRYRYAFICLILLMLFYMLSSIPCKMIILTTLATQVP